MTIRCLKLFLCLKICQVESRPGHRSISGAPHPYCHFCLGRHYSNRCKLHLVRRAHLEANWFVQAFPCILEYCCQLCAHIFSTCAKHHCQLSLSCQWFLQHQSKEDQFQGWRLLDWNFGNCNHALEGVFWYQRFHIRMVNWIFGCVGSSWRSDAVWFLYHQEEKAGGARAILYTDPGAWQQQ